MKRVIKSKIEMLLVFIMFLFFGCGFKPVDKIVLLAGMDSDKRRFLKPAINGDRIRVLCWNIHKENDEASFRDALGDLLRPDSDPDNSYPAYGKPDIALFQEVFMNEGGHEIDSEASTGFGHFMMSSHGMGWVFAPNICKNQAYGGVLTASGLRPVETHPVLSDDSEYLTNTPKASLITTYSLDGFSYDLMVVNVHGINFKPGLAEFKRQMQTIMERVKTHAGPVILAGDFNTWRLKRLELLDNLAFGAGLEKVKFDQSKQTKAVLGLGYPLDHIYISKDTLSVVDGRALVIDRLRVSDHAPLYVELKIGHAG